MERINMKGVRIPDCIFPSDNKLDIPRLRIDVQPSRVQIPILCYGEQRRSKDMHGEGILHFYTDDYRWMSIYDNPEKILRHNPGAIVEPNYSLFNETPIAVGLRSIYQNRWIARLMQDYGIPIFVDLNVANKWYALNLLGVPKGYGSFCTRGYSDRLTALDYEYQLANSVAEGIPRIFLVYGGGVRVQEWCINHPNAYYITPVITIKNQKKAIEKMKENVAMFDVESQQRSLPIQDILTAK